MYVYQSYMYAVTLFGVKSAGTVSWSDTSCAGEIPPLYTCAYSDAGLSSAGGLGETYVETMRLALAAATWVEIVVALFPGTASEPTLVTENAEEIAPGSRGALVTSLIDQESWLATVPRSHETALEPSSYVHGAVIWGQCVAVALSNVTPSGNTPLTTTPRAAVLPTLYGVM